MAEHTSGPWEVRELLPDGVIIRRSGTYEIRTPEYDVASDVPHGGPFRKLADAQLAAAAPDLLAACKADKVLWNHVAGCADCLMHGAHRRDVRMFCPIGAPLFTEARNLTDAAIAKAQPDRKETHD